MDMASRPRSVEGIFKDYRGRRNALIRALTIGTTLLFLFTLYFPTSSLFYPFLLADVNEFYGLCDPDKENLSLYGHPNDTWEVALPVEEVPPDLPEPALGINFARDDLDRSNWLSLVAVHSDSWLLSVAFYHGARLNNNERKRLFDLINDFPTIFEVVTGKKPIKDKPTVASGSKSRGNTKKSSDRKAKSIAKFADEGYEEAEDEHHETLCGSCCGNYNADEFWIGCDICERWFHGKCVNITPAKAESIKLYK
ncbi:PHD finger protein ALFIN-LIKE 1, partial [Mucuna pruriens]